MAEDCTGIVGDIERLRRDRHAVILAHNYQPPEIQDISDFCGDSLELSRRAADSDAETIVFCGVHFMAETAAILSPEKTVLLPRLEAGCPMADMIDAERLREARRRHPEGFVVCYMNTTAAVKALSDVCCTSANAERVVLSAPPDREILFVPDEHLAANVERRTGRSMIRWPGFCPVHARIELVDLERARRLMTDAEVWAHPECPVHVTAAADRVLSTGGMIRAARETAARAVIVATETGLLHRLRRERPDVTFAAATDQARCPTMKLTRLVDVRDALARMAPVVRVPEDVRNTAEAALRRMLEVA